MPQYGFWSDVNNEPMRQYRFLMYIDKIPQWIVKKVGKPELEIGESAHQYLNHTFYYPTRAKWNTVSLTLVDPVTPHASRTMLNILQASGYHYPENSSDVRSISKKSAVLSLGSVVIEQIGADGEVIESWEFVNAWISKTKFGELDYSKDDMVNLELTLRFDYARMNLPRDGSDAGIPAGNY